MEKRALNETEILKKDTKNDTISALKQGKDMKINNEILDNRINKAINTDEISVLPTQTFKDIKGFQKLFDKVQGSLGYIKTPYKEIKVRIPYAYRHFYENTYNKNRDNIKSAFFETFKNPLFVIKEMRNDKESVYFYKPFYDKNNKNKEIMHLFGIGIDSDGKINYKTFYWDEDKTRITRLLKSANENVIYIKD